MRAAHLVMGTRVTVDVRDPGVAPAALAAAFSELDEADLVFSTYRPDSEVCRIDRGELRAEDASAAVRQVLDLCARYERATGGAFSAWIGGRLDPSGLVKGWAVDRACSVLERHGARNYLVDAGGDVVARGHSRPGAAWRVGIRHPVERSKVARVVLATDLAVATSGTYERGAHVHDPRAGAPAAAGLVSVTVAGSDIVEADVWATAVLVLGASAGLDLIERLDRYEAYAISDDLRATWTSGFAALCDPAH
ncbi:MAG TPA: FAD:protein FMN transferase [Candidatus Dormibacteraeota bacterium]|nr:FAD:protein FMN transferase [Candidatus Dormibacteraeota bacterium]